MFDPHRTRRSDRRYYTRKGQVLQASCVNVNPTIDQRLVPIYKNYLLKNNLISVPPQPTPPAPTPDPPVQNKIKPIGIAVTLNSTSSTTYYPFTGFNYETQGTFELVANPLAAWNALLLFQERQDGSFYFTTILFENTYRMQITNNRKCYYGVIEVVDTMDFLNSPKSLYHTSAIPANLFITIDADPASETSSSTILPPVNIEL